MAKAKQEMSHKPLLFASTDDAVTYLMLAGFEVDGKAITCNPSAPATHRTLHAIAWLVDQGFTYFYNDEPCSQ
jgi:hypothetical protein